MARPNILLLMVDQLTGTWFEDGPAGFLDAPNLRRVSDTAVNFKNAYCASPLCVPSRAAFMTGLLPSRTGVYDNAAELPAGVPTFAHYLRRAGYRTALSGKMHFVGPDQLHGFEERLTTDIYPADFGWTPDYDRPGERIDWWYHNMSSVTGAGVAEISNQLEFDDETAYHARLKLYQFARESSDRPFCLTVSFTHPHDPYVARRTFWERYAGVDIPAPSTPAIDFEQHDPHGQRILLANDYQNYTITDEHVRSARRAYCANVSYVDDQIGEILAVLKTCGLDRDTVVIFCSDHGDMLGERGLWYKMSFREPSMRVPLMLHAPERFAPARIEEPVSLLDILPTLLDLAEVPGADRVEATDGASLMDLAHGGRAAERAVLGEYAAEASVAPMVMLRGPRFKTMICEADPPQLFDLQADPLELTDLGGDPDYAGQLAEHTARIHACSDLAAMDSSVRLSQRRRHLVHAALRQGAHHAWDYQPPATAHRRYMRNHLDLNKLELDARFPRPGTGQ